MAVDELHSIGGKHIDEGAEISLGVAMDQTVIVYS